MTIASIFKLLIYNYEEILENNIFIWIIKLDIRSVFDVINRSRKQDRIVNIVFEII